MALGRQRPSSRRLDWPALALPAVLRESARSIEFTCCGLLKKGSTGPVTNIFTSAVVRSREPSTTWRFRTPSPIAIVEGDLGFAILEGEVPAEEGMSALDFDDELVLPLYPRDGRVVAPGEWIPPRFWGRGDVAMPRWFPRCHEPFWTVERFPSETLGGMELSPDARARIAAEIRTHLGVDVPRERWGEVVVAIADPRVWTAAEPAQGPRLGVEILPRRANAPERFVVVTRTRRLGSIEFSRTHVLPAGRHVVPFPKDFEEMEVEISDASSGFPIDRHVGKFFRELQFSMDTSFGPPTLVEADFLDPPRMVELRFVERHRSIVGGREAWEVSLSRESRRREIDTLRRSGQVAFYLGSLGPHRDADRHRAIADVRSIIRAANTRVWIWDKYFGAADFVDFVAAVADRRCDVRVMTSSVADGGIPRIERALTLLRHAPGANGGGLRGLEVRLGPRAPSHDRFILTDDRCVMLGCSFNQLGNVCSSILEFPDRDAVEAAFVRAWGGAAVVEASR